MHRVGLIQGGAHALQRPQVLRPVCGRPRPRTCTPCPATSTRAPPQQSSASQQAQMVQVALTHMLLAPAVLARRREGVSAAGVLSYRGKADPRRSQQPERISKNKRAPCIDEET